MSQSKKRTTNATPSGRQRATRSARKQSWLPWAGLAGLVIVVVVAVLAILAMQDSQGAAGAGNGTPNLVVDQTRVDFGDVPVNQMVKANFNVRNTGDGPLTLVVPPVPEVVEGC